MSSAMVKKEVIEKNQINFQNDFEVLEDTLFSSLRSFQKVNSIKH